jgi:hypothetical protein
LFGQVCERVCAALGAKTLSDLEYAEREDVDALTVLTPSQKCKLLRCQYLYFCTGKATKLSSKLSAWSSSASSIHGCLSRQRVSRGTAR